MRRASVGRRDAVQVTLEVVAECRRLMPNLVVTWEAGWEKLGNGTAANYEGGIVHHTATPSSLTRPFPTQTLLRVGRSDLPGPLCNFAGPACTLEQPRLHVMAAFPANHAGASGGRSMGPLPKTSLFNPRVMGLEIDYAGNVPMALAQLYVGKVWTRAVANVLARGDVEYVRAHMETSVTGKFDIGWAPGKTYDMPGWRRDAAALKAPTEATPAPTGDDDMPDPFWFEWNAAVIAETNRLTKDLHTMMGAFKGGGEADLFRPFFAAAAAQGAASVRPAVDEKALAAALAPLLVQRTQSLSPADLAAVAKAVADEQHRRSAD